MHKYLLSLIGVVSIIFLTACNSLTMNSSQKIFPQGQQVPNDHFTGNVYLRMLATDENNVFNTQSYNVEFEAGARTHWHSHPGGQILIATEGIGLYQEEGQPIQRLIKGDVVECNPDIKHWHGASPESSFAHIGISTRTYKGAVEWLEEVSDEEYLSS